MYGSRMYPAALVATTRFYLTTVEVDTDTDIEINSRSKRYGSEAVLYIAMTYYI